MANDLQLEKAKNLVREMMGQAGSNNDSVGRAIINAVIEQYREYRKPEDIASELRYIADNLDEDEFVITRGC